MEGQGNEAPYIATACTVGIWSRIVGFMPLMHKRMTVINHKLEKGPENQDLCP